MKPTNQQRNILRCEGNAVVIAAPGSGKTFVIASKIKKNLDGLMDHQGIIAISYTNKASNELKHRSLSNGENPRSSFFGTIDKFYLSEIVIPFGKHVFGVPVNDLKIVALKTLDEEKQVELWWITREITAGSVDRVQLKALNSLFLDGTIILESVGFLANHIFDKSLACRNYLTARYKYIYIDEYQDSGLQQHQLFMKINGLGIIAIAVGDLNQSIYAFSGKNAIYLSELAENKKFSQFKLEKNHRCDPSIINYSNFLLDKNTPLVETKDSHVYFGRVDGGEKETATEMDKFLSKWAKQYEIEHLGQVAILTRSRRTAEIIDENLKLPHTYLESNELDMHLNIWSSIFSALLHYVFDPSFQFTDVVEIIGTYENFSQSELKKIAKLKTELEYFREDPLADTESLSKTMIKIAELIAPRSASTESIKLLTNVLMPPYSTKGYLPTGKDQVKIMTIHKSKGLEFDLVIHLDLHEWVFPKKKPGPNNDFKKPLYTDWQQDLNLHYVAVTRAKKACILLSSTKRTNNEGQVKNGNDSEFLSLNNIQKLRFTPKAN